MAAAVSRKGTGFTAGIAVFTLLYLGRKELFADL